jgi:hypothetical protein
MREDAPAARIKPANEGERAMDQIYRVFGDITQGKGRSSPCLRDKERF